MYTINFIDKMPPNTPPPSPGITRETEEIEGEMLEDDDVVEVIDLDDLDGDDDEEQLMQDDENDMSVDTDIDIGSSLDNESSAHEKIAEVNSTIVFSLHKKSVFSCDISPNVNLPLAASGGEDDRAFIWNYKTGELVIELNSSNNSPIYKDSVIFVRFNKDGSLVAAADMSGAIIVWRIRNNCTTNSDNTLDSQSVIRVETKQVWSFDTSDISWLDWHSGASNVLFAGTEESELWMWKVPSGDSKVYMGSGEKVEAAILMPDGKRIAVAYGDGNIKLFDLKTGDVLNTYTHYDKTNETSDNEEPQLGLPIASLDVRSEGGGQILVSGGVNGIAKVYNTQTGKAIASLACPLVGSREAHSSNTPKTTTVEAVLFSKLDQNLIITGTLDGIVTTWDVSTHVSKNSVNVGEGVVKMDWRNTTKNSENQPKSDTSNFSAVGASHSHINKINSQSQIFIATLDGVIKIMDTRTGVILGECSGHNAGILDISQSIDGNILISSSDDGDCRVYDVEKVISESERNITESNE